MKENTEHFHEGLCQPHSLCFLNTISLSHYTVEGLSKGVNLHVLYVTSRMDLEGIMSEKTNSVWCPLYVE